MPPSDVEAVLHKRLVPLPPNVSLQWKFDCGVRLLTQTALPSNSTELRC